MENKQGYLSKLTHYTMSIVNRAISLNRGFIILWKANNFSTAIPLIRLQIDNCMRLYAISISENSLEFYDSVLSGVHIKNIKDADGKKMSDDYLITKLDLIFPGFKNLYRNTSGYVHFSNEHMFANNKIKSKRDDSFILQTSIGAKEELEIFEEIDFCYNFFQAGLSLSRLVLSLRKSMTEEINDET
jgi:hypothetical protein